MPDWFRSMREGLEVAALLAGGIGTVGTFIWRRVRQALDVKAAIERQGAANERHIIEQGEQHARALEEFARRLQEHSDAAATSSKIISAELAEVKECVSITREDVAMIFGHLKLGRPRHETHT